MGTLQQWTGMECGLDTPWRCFRLQIDKCVDAGKLDGAMPNTAKWYGRLTYNTNTSLYTIDLCWGATEDPDEQCKCDNHYANIPRFGANSLGPSQVGPDSEMIAPSNECHRLMK